MKKALQITIAGILFTIEEDAYAKLDTYLQSIQQYFGSFEDSKDLINDIEARITEKLTESIKATNNIVTMSNVDAVIAVMGSIEEIRGETPDSSFTKSEVEYTSKKLYRNGEDMVISGVASGFAAYLGTDTLLMRIIFIVLTLITSGTFILIYLICALIMPKAQTATEKVQMRGGPVTLNSFKEVVNEGVENIKKNSANFVSEENKSTLRTFIENILQFFGKVVRLGLRGLSLIVGAGLILGALFGILMSMFAMTNLLFNSTSQYVDFPITQVVTGPIYYIFVILGFALIAIPLGFVISIGIYLLTFKKNINLYASITLIGIWIVSALLLGTLSVRVIPEAIDKVSQLPQYQEITTSIPLTDFTKIEAHGEDTITIVQGPEYSISVTGQQADVENSKLEVKDATLIIDHKPSYKICFFCVNKDVAYIITMPTIEEIEAHGVVKIDAKQITSENLLIDLSGNSELTLQGTTTKLTATLNGSSELTIEGIANEVEVTLEGISEYMASDFITQSTKITAEGSTEASVYAENRLDVMASGISKILYKGNPIVTQSTSGDSYVGTTTPSRDKQQIDRY